MTRDTQRTTITAAVGGGAPAASGDAGAVASADLDLRTHNAALALRIADLEETNKAVLAMYRQLADELEETNSGVVALYAELDERGRQLLAANEAKTRFLRNVSHELRTPVNSILGLTSLLADSRLDAEQSVQVGFLQDSAANLLSLVNELLDLARAESGRQEVTITSVDLGEVLDELRGTTAPLLREGVILEIPEPEPRTLRTDSRLLRHVLRNLLTNAVKFTDSGFVRLTATEEPGAAHGEEARGWLRIDVQDTGLGIEADQLDRVFEEFHQVPNRLQPSVRGSGLGLPYALRTTETLGGTLEVVSTPGEGSTFTVRLPLAADGDADDAEPGTPAQLSEGAPAPLVGRVLVVDDDDVFRTVVVDLLRGSAREVTQAASAREALAVARAAVPDVVLLDVRLPDVDARAGVRRLRKQHPGVPVVRMSSGPPPAALTPDDDVPFVAKADVSRARLRAVLRQVLPTAGAGQAAGAGAREPADEAPGAASRHPSANEEDQR